MEIINRLRRHTRWGAVFILASVLAACGAAPSGRTTAPAGNAATNSNTGATTVRLAHFPNLTHAAALIGVAKGQFRDAFGPDVTLDVKTFNAGPAMIEAMFAGEIDIGYIGPNPAINGYVKSKGDALRIIAGASSGGALLMVRPAANIKAAQDLAGKTIATPQVGGTQDVALRYYLIKNGLQTVDRGGSVTVLPTENPNILTLFKEGKIDGAWVPEPWAARLQIEGQGQVFIDERTLWPDQKFVSTNVIVSRKFLEANPNLVTAFLKAHVAAVEWINANPTEAQTVINSEITRITTKGLPPAVLEQAMNTTTITYDPLAATLFTSADHAFDLGFLGTTKPDLNGIYALDPLNAVLKERNLPLVAER